MSITETPRRAGPYATNGVQTEFVFAFKVFEEGDVVVTSSENGVDTELTLTADYVVELNADQDASPGGTVTTTGTLDGPTITITSNMAATQPTVFTNAGGFFPRVLNNALDRLTILVQQILERLTRVPLLPLGDAPVGEFPVVLPDGSFGWSSGTGNDPALRVDLASLLAGGALVAFIQSGEGAVPETVMGALRRVRFVEQYGYSAGGAAADNLAAIKRGIAACQPGDHLLAGPGTAVVDVLGGLSNAADFNKAGMVFHLTGRIETNGHTPQANPMYWAKVSAPFVTFTGPGWLAGDGTVNDANSGTEADHPGLVYITADHFTFELNVDTPPKVGLAFINCKRGTVRNSTWLGGPSNYTVGNTAYFGIIMVGGGEHSVYNVKLPLGPAGQRFVNFIFTSGSGGSASNVSVYDCHEVYVFEKLFYGYGAAHSVYNCSGYGDGRTDWIRFMEGDGSRAWNVRASGANGGVTCYDGNGFEITSCTFTDCKQVGVHIARLSASYTGGFADIKISDNTLKGDGAATTANGISISLDGSDVSGLTVSNNLVLNFGVAASTALIKVSIASPFSLSDVLLLGNRIGDTPGDGIILVRVLDSVVQGTKARAIGGYLGVENGTARITWLDNTGTSITSIGISGMAATSVGRGNKYTTASLTFPFTFSEGTGANATPYTLVHGGIAPNARVFCVPGNQAYSVACVAKGDPVPSTISAGNINLVSGNNTNYAGTENAVAHIIQ